MNECVVRMTQSILLGYVIDYFGGGDLIQYDHACLAAGGVCLCVMLTTVMDNSSRVRLSQLGMRARSACCTLMYKKSLKLNQLSMEKTTVGQIINLMSNDVNRFDRSGMCILMTAKLTDSRLQHMVEIISSMRIVKMYSWEQSFADHVAEARKQEVSCIQRSCFLKAINISLLMVFLCFTTLILTGGVLYAKAVFVSMMLVTSIRANMTRYFPESITLGAELLVSYGKQLPEVSINNITAKWSDCNLSWGNFSWGNTSFGETDLKYILETSLEETLSIRNTLAMHLPESPCLTLENISVHLKAGDLLAVIGPVGAGKSSLLMTILNELPVLSGSIETVGTMSYASQESWSFNTSVRNNILFGAEYNKTRYKRVVEVCALVRDFERFPFGDKSLVGERGVQLSGGQKARVTLARALYQNSDIVLMDDPLSAVDPCVAEHIFDNLTNNVFREITNTRCIVDYLCDKIRILVTHQIQFIRKATQILVLNDEGKCLGLGSYDELQSRGLDFMSILSDQEKEVDDKAEQNMEDTYDSKINAQGTLVAENLTQNAEQNMEDTYDSKINAQGTLVAENLTQNNAENVMKPKIIDEGRETGSISWNVYCTFIKAGDGPLLTDKNQNTNNITTSEQNRDVLIYSSLMVALFIASLLRAITWFVMFMRASVNLHNTIFYRLLRAPMSVFENNPVGQILNRFSKDLGTVDEQLPTTALELNLSLTQGVGGIIIITIVNPYMIIPSFILIVVVLAARAVYIKSARDIKRAEGLRLALAKCGGMARSPVYSHVSTTLNGLASIRAFGAQDVFERQFYIYQDDHSATWMLVTTASYAFALIIDGLCFLYTVIIFTVFMVFPEKLGAGETGLALTSALTLMGLTAWGVRLSAEVESQMTSVERIIEYSKLPQEAALTAHDSHKPPPDWPQAGQIELKDISLYYSGSDKPVLKNLTCVIKSGEKIGICGRTGAGKSSIISALFRMVEPKGAIVMDGINTGSIGLRDLRSAISIIPQDPVVFTGSVRKNLDPFGEYSDQNMWSSLEDVQLRGPLGDLPGQLDGLLAEGGANLSVGQRQLVCLARAILRHNRVLVLDEATANVDHQTDALIQTTICRKFSDCTVLTIAHRLNTIINCDRVLVLDAGEIVEFDEPFVLLQRKGQLYDMCRQTGKHMFNRLLNMAKESHFKRFTTRQVNDEDRDRDSSLSDEIYDTKMGFNKIWPSDIGDYSGTVEVTLHSKITSAVQPVLSIGRGGDYIF
ncbi:unnamed protein product [Medioppia subpectinata]|uniref:Uncharacterized protein n=1 Tax=Medioppia subpectinata TaxID=1979941 RepID=A0A7R9KD95_9ACAR|nr:unnamed protein product [Medioppia subpectinata]CAG2101388.1 unnamed protein product [Medioppia subpectinata]